MLATQPQPSPSTYVLFDPGKSKKPNSYDPMPVKHRTIFTPEERIELKQIINEALDEREKNETS